MGSLKQIEVEFYGCVDICEKNEVLAIKFRVWGIKILSSSEIASDRDMPNLVRWLGQLG